VLEGRFHHIGVACNSLDREAEGFKHLRYMPEGPDFEDPIQGIQGRFLVGQGPRVELLSPLRPGGVLDPWLRRGAKMYHLAYLVADLPLELARLQATGARLVAVPVPAVAFGGRAIAFLMLPNMMLVEFIQEVP
jgi:methylmalonyl-CoA/ethylmalonyl-CoA epimerase